MRAIFSSMTSCRLPIDCESKLGPAVSAWPSDSESELESLPNAPCFRGGSYSTPYLLQNEQEVGTLY
jgi:hypothetical protein